MCIRWPGRHLEQVEDRVALAKRVPEHRDRAEVERRRAEPDQVRVDPVELEKEGAQVLGPRRDLELEQPLDRAAERLHVEEVGDVVHPLDERDHLPVALVLAGLLDPGVHVADHRLQVEHLLALEADQQPQDPVGRGVVRAPCSPSAARARARAPRRPRCARSARRRSPSPRSRRSRRRRWRRARARRPSASGGAARLRFAPPHCDHPGTWCSLWVKITGSPPTGKSRRCGQPT